MKSTSTPTFENNDAANALIRARIHARHRAVPLPGMATGRGDGRFGVQRVAEPEPVFVKAVELHGLSTEKGRARFDGNNQEKSLRSQLSVEGRNLFHRAVSLPEDSGEVFASLFNAEDQPLEVPTDRKKALLQLADNARNLGRQPTLEAQQVVETLLTSMSINEDDPITDASIEVEVTEGSAWFRVVSRIFSRSWREVHYKLSPDAAGVASFSLYSGDRCFKKVRLHPWMHVTQPKLKAGFWRITLLENPEEQARDLHRHNAAAKRIIPCFSPSQSAARVLKMGQDVSGPVNELALLHEAHQELAVSHQERKPPQRLEERISRLKSQQKQATNEVMIARSEIVSLRMALMKRIYAIRLACYEGGYHYSTSV